MILVYGGSFNPPTKAHLNIVNLLDVSLKPSKIILLPVGDTYTWKNKLVSFDKRKEMIEILTKDFTNVKVSNLEQVNHYLGTFDALNKISDLYKTKDIYFVFGTDNLTHLTKWINYESLLKIYGFVIIKRPNYKLDLSLFETYKTKFKVLDFDSDISSTKIRENLIKHQDDLTKEVFTYIMKNHLYQGENT